MQGSPKHTILRGELFCFPTIASIAGHMDVVQNRTGHHHHGIFGADRNGGFTRLILVLRTLVDQNVVRSSLGRSECRAQRQTKRQSEASASAVDLLRLTGFEAFIQHRHPYPGFAALISPPSANFPSPLTPTAALVEFPKSLRPTCLRVMLPVPWSWSWSWS